MSVSVARIYNVPLTNADTEYSQALSPYARAFMIQCRTFADLKIAFNVGESGTVYISIPGSSSYSFDQPVAGVKTVYIQSPSAGVVVEILEWS